VTAARALSLSLTGALLWAAAAAAQISPGPLVQAHADLDGSRDCLSCHASGQGVDPARCLSCHAILGQRVAASQGLHAQQGYADCRLCHIDHQGRDYDLVYWGAGGMERFDHRLAGWPREGAHRERGCRDCHKAELVRESQRLRDAGKRLDRTFLGLSTTCADCHRDEHEGQLTGTACDTCHDAEAWKPTAGFDHAATSFALTGRHADVACGECHHEEPATDGGTLQRFKPVPHGECSACHRDPHEGALGASCSDCHATAAWHVTPGFDHAATRYPLTGEHRRVACDACHRTTGGQMLFRGLPFAACSDCHADPHAGRLGANCSSCHSTGGWATIAVGQFDHSATDYPLEGAHATVRCEACHAAGAPLRIAEFGKCTNCHADAHLGQLAHRDDGGACESCHSVAGFKPPDFTEDDHRDTRFALAGEHRAVACVECHAETAFRRVGASEVVMTAKLRYASLECADCHTDPHRGAADRWNAQGGCAACHSDGGWKVSVFDHATTEFPLLGRHSETECGRCHAPEEAVGDEHPLRLDGTPVECAACHDEPHRGQFADRAGGCETCHTAVSWQDLSFDHDRDSAFRLEGAHARALCASCHLPTPGPGEPFVLYAPLPTSCEGCHAGA
jgi:hypothetical protein